MVPMEPCQVQRPVDGFYVNSSKQLVRKGTVDVGEETFTIYLPQDKGGWSTEPRANRRSILTQFTSTYLAVDQDHDGRISEYESSFAELPLRLGDTMFTIESIADDGTMTLLPSDGPLTGAVIGRKAPDFAWPTKDGGTIRRDDLLGRTTIIDCWAPS